ncbi:cysteine hydrolase family protein [Glaciihabitans sp. dw_435]|uniref:cysteine hydrolase family protein n=1 Tax=Glaciihabitans sp. dw_435 TaxID=2720081 RepID=UPI001BD45D99|nr:cysteine hydrolase family protein [Glaciihabitans sp. dw_435]
MTTTPAHAIADNAALIVIDVQEGFADSGYWGPRNNPAADANVEALIREWEATGRPIVVVQHDSSSPASPLHPAGAGNDLKPYVRRVASALHVRKTVNSAFYGTPDLGEWLRASGISQIVITGIQTNMCCETTARMAGNLGYDVLFAADATHTFDLAGLGDDVMTADELARATVTNLQGGGFATVVSTADLLAASAAAAVPVG